MRFNADLRFPSLTGGCREIGDPEGFQIQVVIIFSETNLFPMGEPYQQFIGNAFYQLTLSIHQNQHIRVRIEKDTLSND